MKGAANAGKGRKFPAHLRSQCNECAHRVVSEHGGPLRFAKHFFGSGFFWRGALRGLSRDRGRGWNRLPRDQAPAWSRTGLGSSASLGPTAGRSAPGLSTPTKRSFADKCVPKLELGNERTALKSGVSRDATRSRLVMPFRQATTLRTHVARMVRLVVMMLPELEAVWTEKALVWGFFHLHLRQDRWTADHPIPGWLRFLLPGAQASAPAAAH